MVTSALGTKIKQNVSQSAVWKQLPLNKSNLPTEDSQMITKEGFDRKKPATLPKLTYSAVSDLAIDLQAMLEI